MSDFAAFSRAHDEREAARPALAGALARYVMHPDETGARALAEGAASYLIAVARTEAAREDLRRAAESAPAPDPERRICECRQCRHEARRAGV